MIGSSIVSLKLASAALTREMVNSETARRLVPNVLDSSKRWILSKLPQNHNYHRLQTHDEVDPEQQQHQQEAASAEYLVHHWLEALFAWFQVIVLWHEPRVSLCAITGLLSSFLLLTYFAPRFYATIMVALFLYNLSRFWFRHVWPEIRVPPGRDREEEQRLDVDRWTYLHPHLMTLSELQQHFGVATKSGQQYLNRLLALRQNRPVAFASLLCLLFTCTAFLGNRITGMSLVFWTLTALMTAPGIYVHLLTEHTKSRLWQSLDGLKSYIIATTTTTSSFEFSKSDHDEHHDDQAEEVAATSRTTTTTTTATADQDQPHQQQVTTSDQADGGDDSTSTAPKEENLIELDDYVML